MASKFSITAELNLQTKNLNQVVGDLRKQFQGVDLNIKVKDLDKAGSSIRSVTKASRDASTAVSGLGSDIATAAKKFSAVTLATGTLIGFTRAVKNAVSDAIQFEREVVKIAQASGKTVTQLKTLKDEVSSVSTTFGVSSKELILAARTLTQAGFAADKAAGALRVLAQTDLAATFDSIQDTTEGAIAVLNQFGKEAQRTGSEVQFLENAFSAINQVSKKFAVESADLITAIRTTGSAFESAGGSLNELIGLFTSVRATTRESAESIATGFRTIFTRTQRLDTINNLRQLGIELQDAEGKFVGPIEATKRLSAALSVLDPKDFRFNLVVEELGGFRQVSKVIPLIQQFAVAQKALNVAQGASGSLAKDAQTAQQSLAVQIAQTTEKFNTFIRNFSQSSTFQSTAKALLSIADAFLNVAESIQPLIPLIASFASFKIGQSITKSFLDFGSVVAKKNSGGKIHHFASGGFVPGTGNGDTVPAMLTPGEFVIRKSSVKKLGAENLARVNKYAVGGPVEIKDLDSSAAQTSLWEGAPNKTKFLGLKDDTFKVKKIRQEFLTVKKNKDKDKNIQNGYIIFDRESRANKEVVTDEEVQALFSNDKKAADTWEILVARLKGGTVHQDKGEGSFPVDITDSKSDRITLRDAKFKAEKEPINNAIKKVLNYKLYEKFKNKYNYTKKNVIGDLGLKDKLLNTKIRPMRDNFVSNENFAFSYPDLKLSKDDLEDLKFSDIASDKNKSNLDKANEALTEARKQNKLDTIKYWENFIERVNAGQTELLTLDQSEEKFNKKFLNKVVPYVNFKEIDESNEKALGGIIQKFQDGGRAEAFRSARAITIPQPESYTYNKPAGIDLDSLTGDSKNYKVNAGDRLQYKRINHNIDLDKENVSSGLFSEYKAETDPAKRGKIFEKILLSLGQVQSLSRMQNARLDAISASGNPSEIKSRQEAMNIKELEEKLWGAIVNSSDGSLAEMMTRERMNSNRWTDGEDLFNIGNIDVFEDITGGLGKEINAKEVRTRQEVQAVKTAKEMTKAATNEARAKLQAAVAAVVGKDSSLYNIKGTVLPPLSGKGELYSDTVTAVRKALNIDNVADLWPAIAQMQPSEIQKAVKNSIQRKATGGFIEKFANGGFSSGTDTVPAMLTPGEFVINKKSAEKIGYSSLNRMNKVGKYADGGVVRYYANGTDGEGVEPLGKKPSKIAASRVSIKVQQTIDKETAKLATLSGEELVERKKYIRALKALKANAEAQAILGYDRQTIEKTYNRHVKSMIKNGVFNSEESEGRVKFFGKAIAKSIQVQQEYNDKLQNAKDNLEKLKEEGKTLQSRDFSKKSVNQEEIKQQNINSLASTQKKDFDKLIENSGILSNNFLLLGSSVGALASQLAGLDSEVSSAISTFSASLTVYKSFGDAFVNFGADALAESLSRKRAEKEYKKHEGAIDKNKRAIESWEKAIQSGAKVSREEVESTSMDTSPERKKGRGRGKAGAAAAAAGKATDLTMKAFSYGINAAKGAVLGFSTAMAAANAATVYFEKKAKKSADILDKEMSKLKDNFNATSEAVIKSKTQAAFSSADYASSLKEGTKSSMGTVAAGAGIGALVGSIFGPLGAGIGGVVGGFIGLTSVIGKSKEIFERNEKTVEKMSSSYAKSMYESQKALQDFNREIKFIGNKSKDEVGKSFENLSGTAMQTSQAYNQMQKDLIQTYGSIDKAPAVFQSALNSMSGQVQALNNAMQQYEAELLKRAGVELANAASVGGGVDSVIQDALKRTDATRTNQAEATRGTYKADIETEIRNRAARRIYQNTNMVASEENVSKLTADNIDESKLTPEQKKMRQQLQKERKDLEAPIDKIVEVTKKIADANAEKALREMALQALKNEKAALLETQAREKVIGSLNKELALRISLENLNRSLSSINKTVEGVEAAFNGAITGLASSIPDESVFDLLKPTGKNLEDFNTALQKIRSIDKPGGPNVGGQLADNIGLTKQASLRLESVFSEIGQIARDDIPEILKRTLGEANVEGPVGEALRGMLDEAIKPTEGDVSTGRGINSKQGRQELIDQFKKFSSELSEKGKGIIKALADAENQQRMIYSKIAESQQRQTELREQDVDSYKRYVSAVAQARGRDLSLTEKNALRLAKQAQSVGPLAGNVDAIGQNFLNASATLNRFQKTMDPQQQARFAQNIGNSERALKQLADQSERTSDTLQEIEKIKGQRENIRGLAKEFATGTSQQRKELEKGLSNALMVGQTGSFENIKEEDRSAASSILERFKDLPIFNGATGRQVENRAIANSVRSAGGSEELAQMIEADTSSAEEQLIDELRNIYEQERQAKAYLSEKENLMQQALVVALQDNAKATAELSSSLASEFQTLESQKQGFAPKQTVGDLDTQIEDQKARLKSLTDLTDGVKDGFIGLNAELARLTESLSKDIATKPLSDIEVAMTYVKSALGSFGDMLMKLVDKVASYLPFSKGGMVYRAGGGSIFKPKGTDTVPAMLTPGEFVIKKSSVDKIGVGALSNINSGGDIGMGASAPGGPGYFNVNDKGLLGNGGFGSYDKSLANPMMANPMMGRPMFAFSNYTDPSQIYAATLGRQADNIRQRSLNAQSTMQSNISNYFTSGQNISDLNKSKAFRQQRKEQGMAIHAAARAHGEKMASSSSYSTAEKDKIYEMGRKQYLKPYRNKFRGVRSYAIGGLVEYLARGGRSKSRFYYGSSRAGKVAKYQARAQKRRDAANKSFSVVRQGRQLQAQQSATQSVNSIMGYNQRYNTERVVPNPVGTNITRLPTAINKPMAQSAMSGIDMLAGFGNEQFDQYREQQVESQYQGKPWNNPERLKALAQIKMAKRLESTGGMGYSRAYGLQDIFGGSSRRQTAEKQYDDYGIDRQYRRMQDIPLQRSLGGWYAKGGSVGGMEDVNSQIKTNINENLDLNKFMGPARTGTALGMNPYAASAISQAYGFATQAFNRNFAGTRSNLYNASRSASASMHSNFFNNMSNGTAQNLFNASVNFRASRGQGGGSSYEGGRSRGFTRGNRTYNRIGEYAASGNTIEISGGKNRGTGNVNPYYMAPGSDRPRVGFADGGFVGTKFYSSGGSASDTLPAMLTPGEFVMNKEAVDKHGVGFMKQLNNGGAVQGFAKGGPVGPAYLAAGGQASGSGGFDFSAIGNVIGSSVRNSLSGIGKIVNFDALNNLASTFSNLVNRLGSVAGSIGSMNMTHTVRVDGQVNIGGLNAKFIAEAIKNEVSQMVVSEVQRLIASQMNAARNINPMG